MCTAHTSAYLRIDLGIQLFGCESEWASIYLSESLLHDYVLPDLIGDIDRLLESLEGALVERLDMDVATFNPLNVYLVQDMQELDLIKRYPIETEDPLTGPIAGAQGWYDCCGDRPGIYAATEGSPMQVVAHEFIHHALSNQYGEQTGLPKWLNEGLARCYEFEFGPVVSTESVFFSASEAQLAAKKGELFSLRRLESNWSSERPIILLQYSQAYMAAQYLIEVYGHSAVARIIELMSLGSRISDAVDRVTEKSYVEFEADFENWLLVWGKGDTNYENYISRSGGTLFCFSPCGGRSDSYGFSFADFAVEATFVNPTRADQFRYGFTIEGPFESGVSDNVEIRVTNNRTWRVYISKHVNQTGLRAGIRPENIELGGGEISSPFDTSAGGSNRLEVVVIRDEGCLYVNGSLISCFDVSGRTLTEDILISSDFGDVWYSGFRAREALVETE